MDQTPLHFPNADSLQPHHPSQWWYWSGRLTSAAGNSWGLKLSFFAAEAITGALWGSMVHAALLDLDTRRVVRTSKQWLGAPRRMEGRFELVSPDRTLRALGGDGRDRLSLRFADYQIDLSLRAQDEPLCHYEGRPHAYAFGGYSYHYSRPQMRANGVLIEPGGNSSTVQGTMWFDRQIGALTPALYQGWQWLALHLDAGDLMLFDFNGVVSERFVVWHDHEGSVRRFAGSEVRLQPLGHWQSPWTGIVYPRALFLETALHRLRITPCVSDQEMRGRRWRGPTYWEGSCSISGTNKGTGYAELVGGIAPLLERARSLPRLGRWLENPGAALILATVVGRTCRMLPWLRPAFPGETAPAPAKPVRVRREPCAESCS